MIMHTRAIGRGVDTCKIHTSAYVSARLAHANALLTAIGAPLLLAWDPLMHA